MFTIFIYQKKKMYHVSNNIFQCMKKHNYVFSMCVCFFLKVGKYNTNFFFFFFEDREKSVHVLSNQVSLSNII